MEEIKLIKKYQRLAGKATFNNTFIEAIKNADLSKGLYENGITTGTAIDGKCITLKTVAKYCGEGTIHLFKEAIRQKKNFQSFRFNLYGYDGSLWVHTFGNGMISAGLNKEYRGCGNGYYYLLINDDTFIGYDID